MFKRLLDYRPNIETLDQLNTFTDICEIICKLYRFTRIPALVRRADAFEAEFMDWGHEVYLELNTIHKS